MIKVTELMIDEDGQVSIGEFEFESLAKLREYEFYECLKSGSLVQGKPEYLDNFGNPIPAAAVQEFEEKIKGKHGSLVEWSAEYDANWWFVEAPDILLVACGLSWWFPGGIKEAAKLLLAE